MRTTGASDQPTLLGPSTFKVTGSPNSDCADGGGQRGERHGMLIGKLAGSDSDLGWYSICETVPPVGHWNAKPSCKRVSAASGVPGFGRLLHEPRGTVYQTIAGVASYLNWDGLGTLNCSEAVHKQSRLVADAPGSLGLSGSFRKVRQSFLPEKGFPYSGACGH